MRLKDKIAVITGAGSGQGRSASLLYAREGAKIVATDWKPELGDETVAMVKAAGGQAVFVKADVSSSADVQNVIRTRSPPTGESMCSTITPASASRHRSR